MDPGDIDLSLGFQKDSVRWTPLYYTSLVLIPLTILLSRTHPVGAALLAFALLGTWSRVPCMYSLLTKDLEFLDFFTVMVAVNLGALIGGAFGIIVFLFSALFAKKEPFVYIASDAVCFLAGGLLTPLFFHLTGNNLLITMYLFTVVRYGLSILFLVAMPQFLLVGLQLLAIGAVIAYTTNTVMVTFFGDITSLLFQEGLGFNMYLLSILIILGAYIIIGKTIDNWLKGKGTKPKLEITKAERRKYI